MSQVDALLLGIIAMACVIAGTYFLKFWRSTHDMLFAAFAAFFFIEAADRVVLSFSARPNEGSPWIYVARLIGLLLILAAILRKNYGSRA
ncbi:MAG TPA: DUF5985 family protein [Candidatus Limnocylindrales bacterium]|nr:DUF5985 family protein [Candidatus Limnocylindrales bacterium]